MQKASFVYLLIAVASALIAAGSSATRAGDDLASPDQAYVARLVEPVSYEVDFSVVVTPPYHAKVLKIWLPLPQTDNAQQITESHLSTFLEQIEPKIGKESVYGNKFAYFEFHEPQGGQIIRHQFRATVWELRWDLDPAKVQPLNRWPESFAPYLRSTEKITSENEFLAVLSGIEGQAAGPSERLFCAMDWIDRSLTYDHAHASLRASAEHAFTERRGHCSDYHGLCAVMGRSLGSPTRVTYGMNLFPKNSPSHCKLEAFLHPYGWVSFDISETQNLVNQIHKDSKLGDSEKEELTRAAKKRLKSGFRDNTWLLLTKGTDYDLVPPASQSVRVVRTLYAEADGETLPDPDPANVNKREFGWMTVHRYVPDRPVTYPFKDIESLVSYK